MTGDEASRGLPWWDTSIGDSECAPRSEKRLLERIVRVEGRRQHPVAMSVKLGDVRLDETTERVFVSSSNGIEKRSPSDPETLAIAPEAIPAGSPRPRDPWSGGDEFRATPRLYRVR